MIRLICGLPNAGKTTYSSRFDFVLHYDNFWKSSRNPHEQYTQCNGAAAQADGDVCVEGVYNSRLRRMEFLEAVKDKPGKRVCIWLDAPIEVCLEREKNYRKRPLGIVHAHARSFEPPTLDEGWDEIRIIKWEERHEKDSCDNVPVPVHVRTLGLENSSPAAETESVGHSHGG